MICEDWAILDKTGKVIKKYNTYEKILNYFREIDGNSKGFMIVPYILKQDGNSEFRINLQIILK